MKLKKLTRCALFAALMAICAWLAVPVGEISVTMQSFALFLTLGLLGGRQGSAACAVYLLLGAVGLPVFSGFQGGFGVLLGPTGGYLWGFLAAALIYWLVSTRFPKWLAMGLGMLGCYACGTAWFYFAYGQIGLWAVLLKCVAPYLLPDAAKIAFALLMAKKIENMT